MPNFFQAPYMELLNLGVYLFHVFEKEQYDNSAQTIGLGLGHVHVELD